MRYIFFYLILFLTGIFANAQDTKEQTSIKDLNLTSFEFEYEKECGSPLVESQTFSHRQGKVIEVVNGNSIIFEQLAENENTSKEKFTVQLVGIDSSKNEEKLKLFLLKNVLNQNVEIIGNTKKDADKTFFGIIQSKNEDFDVVNRYFLENGMAKFSEPEYFYSVSRYTLCVYQKVEEKANKAKLGIWAK